MNTQSTYMPMGLWCRIFAITSSAVNRFWKLFHCWKQQWIIYKINIIFYSPALKNLVALPRESV